MSQADVEKHPLLEDDEAATNTNTATANLEQDPNHQPSLRELQNNVFAAQRAYMRAWSRTTSGKWHRRIMLTVTALLVGFLLFCGILITNDALTDDDMPGSYYGQRVPLEAHIMSKCPDARDCLHELILPAMQNVSHKVDFKLSYIGSVTHEDDGVACKHGPDECLGNILELCAAYLYPDPMLYLGFTMCLSNQYREVPSEDLVRECALEHGISFEKLNRCAVDEDGGMSVGMLRESFERSAAANVTTSCTVRLAESEWWCVRDGAQWKNCSHGHTAADLVKSIEDAYGMPSWDEWRA
ncbi:hypothetical protein MBLNU230_g3039t1 [Neophaeotheca triangularis]